MPMKIDKCICSNITFTEVKDLAGKKCITELSNLSEAVDVARNCKLCTPYLREMFRTGQTEFHKPIFEKE
jgi:bacterioferritin-associated ferredoxin